MSEPIKPALTPEEWAAMLALEERAASKGERLVEWAVDETYELDRHGLAALALHGQPFGFSREDVEAIRALARHARVHMERYTEGAPVRPAHIEQALAATDRIAALLPPETP